MKNYTVYRHTNKANGKVYIGITSQSPEARWKNGKGYTTNRFRNAIEKYGWDNFLHEIIVTNISKQDACEIERILINAHDATNPQKGYNETLGGEGGGMYGKHHSQESKNKISDARKRNGFTEQHKMNISLAQTGAKHHAAKKVYQYTKNNELIKSWDCMSIASRELNINKANIAETCNGNRKTAGGFIWRYERM